jgi:hypothetical protein
MSAAEPSPSCGQGPEDETALRTSSTKPCARSRRFETSACNAGAPRRRSAPQRPGTRPHRGWARPGGPALRPACPDRSRRPGSCPGSAPAAGRRRCPAPRATGRPGVQGAIRVQHTDDLAGGGQQTRVHSGAVARSGLPNDVRTAPQSDLDRAVRRPVVDDHGAVTRWKGSQYTGRRSRFVQAR